MDLLKDENLPVAIAIYAVLIMAGLAVDVFLLARSRAGRLPWDDHKNWLIRRPWQAHDLGILLLVYLAVLLLVSLFHPLLARWESAFGEELSPGWLILQSLSFHVLGIVLIVGVIVKRGYGSREALGIERKAWTRAAWLGPFCYLALVPPLFFYTFLYQAVLQSYGHDPAIQDVALSLTDRYSLPIQVYLLFLGVVLAPFAEEMIFRGVMLPILARVAGVPRAILIVSLAFALMHGHLDSFLPLFLMGVALSLAYMYGRSILVPAVMHAVFNAVSLGLLVLLRYL